MTTYMIHSRASIIRTTAGKKKKYQVRSNSVLKPVKALREFVIECWLQLLSGPTTVSRDLVGCALLIHVFDDNILMRV
jgi:hypothetical protein